MRLLHKNVFCNTHNWATNSITKRGGFIKTSSFNFSIYENIFYILLYWVWPMLQYFSVVHIIRLNETFCYHSWFLPCIRPWTLSYQPFIWRAIFTRVRFFLRAFIFLKNFCIQLGAENACIDLEILTWLRWEIIQENKESSFGRGLS